MGNNSDPVTLHKYAYGNLDPVNNIDPSGNMSLGSLLAGIGNMFRLATTAVGNASRAVATRVNGAAVRGIASLKTRIWLTRHVGSVQSKLPKNIFAKGKLSKNKKGWRWGDNKNNVRLQKGNPKHIRESMREDYVQLRVEGKGMVGRNGEKISTKFSDEAHIPLKEWKTWARWDSPI